MLRNDTNSVVYQVFRQAFEELLELQKERVREVKKYSREKQQERTRSCNQQMEALENLYLLMFFFKRIKCVVRLYIPSLIYTATKINSSCWQSQ